MNLQLQLDYQLCMLPDSSHPSLLSFQSCPVVYYTFSTTLYVMGWHIWLYKEDGVILIQGWWKGKMVGLAVSKGPIC